MHTLHKYPRTPHIEGSRLQPGDEDASQVPFSTLKGRHLVVEEKFDGANAGLSFDAHGKLWLQSRGHFLIGGEREKHFNLFKQWAQCHAGRFWPVLGDRYILFGEWLYAKHTIFYDQLPHYFLEFDLLDARTGEFQSTERRREMLVGLPLVPAPVLWSGPGETLDQLTALIDLSLGKGPCWPARLTSLCQERGLDAKQISNETDRSDLMEGLYIKVEEQGRVVERYKYVRASFLTTVLASGSHWLRRPIVPNLLRPDVDLFGDSV